MVERGKGAWPLLLLRDIEYGSKAERKKGAGSPLRCAAPACRSLAGVRSLGVRLPLSANPKALDHGIAREQLEPLVAR
jgi:hypothetical protein